MRAFVLLCTLCLATSLQAAEIEAEGRPDTGCQANVQSREAGATQSTGGAPETVAEARAPVVTSPRAGARSPMNTRWHSLLPGMFR